jgi:phytoene dehydrogenase-like protein
MTDAEPKTVIVGGGMAGLTAAAYLAREKHPVLLLDKNDRVGGLVNTFESNGFHFDSGPRAFVNSGMVKPILKDLGLNFEPLENSISIGIEDRLLTINSMDDLQKYQRILVDLYPENQADIEKIAAEIHKLSDYTEVLYRLDNPSFVDFKNDFRYIFKKLLPWSIQLLFVLRKMNKYKQPMEEFLGRLTDNQSLIDIMTQFFFRKTPTDFALGYFYVYLDYFYPKNGTGAVPRLLKNFIQNSGGKIQLNTRVTRILPGKSIVKDLKGNSYPYRHLVWAADLKTLYSSMDLVGLDQSTRQKIEAKNRVVQKAKGAESSFILFLAANRPPSYFQARGGEHLFFTPSKQGLGETIREERKSLVDGFDQKTRAEVFNWIDKFCRLNSYEVSIPALRDPSLAPEGQTGIMISCLFDFELMKKVEQAGWYDEFKARMENQIIQIFSESIYRGLTEDLIFKFSSTPLTIHSVVGSSGGAITGWSFESDVPVKSKIGDIPKTAFTPIPGVFQAGQWAYSPSGVPIAMLTGWHAAQNILKESENTR